MSFVCVWNDCGKAFRSISLLEKHKRTRTFPLYVRPDWLFLDSPADTGRDRLVCHLCSKTYART